MSSAGIENRCIFAIIWCRQIDDLAADDVILMVGIDGGVIASGLRSR